MPVSTAWSGSSATCSAAPCRYAPRRCCACSTRFRASPATSRGDIGKQVDVELRGAQLELDRAILDRLGDPLVHLVRNAVDHGIETPELRSEAGKPPAGRIVVEARREKDHVLISVEDDGRGIDLESVKHRAIEAGVLHADLADELPPDEVAALVSAPGSRRPNRCRRSPGAASGWTR